MGFEDRGEPVKWEFVSADATTAAAITLWDGNSVSRTLAATERFMLLSYTGVMAVAVLNATLFDDLNANGTVDAGERMAEFANIGGGLQAHISGTFEGEGQAGGKGRMPKIKASAAGAIAFSGNGYIIKG